MRITQTIVPDRVVELWFVHDWNDNFQTFKTEGEADRIDEGLGLRAYAVNAFMAKIEKMEKGEKK